MSEKRSRSGAAVVTVTRRPPRRRCPSRYWTATPTSTSSAAIPRPTSPPPRGRGSTGWCRSASTSTPPGGAPRWPTRTKPCWPPWPCTRTRRPGWPTSTRRCARSRRSPRSRGSAASARPGWTSSAPARGRAAQEASFRAHIAIAKRYGKALVIHDRDAHADVLRILDDEGAPDAGGAALLLRRRRVRRRVRPPRLPAQLRRHGHLRQRGAAARGGRGHPARTSCWWRPTRRT